MYQTFILAIFMALFSSLGGCKSSRCDLTPTQLEWAKPKQHRAGGGASSDSLYEGADLHRARALVQSIAQVKTEQELLNIAWSLGLMENEGAVLQACREGARSENPLTREFCSRWLEEF